MCIYMYISLYIYLSIYIYTYWGSVRITSLSGQGRAKKSVSDWHVVKTI